MSLDNRNSCRKHLINSQPPPPPPPPPPPILTPQTPTTAPTTSTPPTKMASLMDLYTHYYRQQYFQTYVNLCRQPQQVKPFVLYPPQHEPLDLSKSSSSKQDKQKAHKRRQAIKKSGRYTCNGCGKAFVQQSSLITHRRIHTGEKPFKCQICNNCYGDLSTFTKHTRTHTGEKPYECEYCNQKFSQSGNCLRHKRSVHSDVFN